MRKVAAIVLVVLLNVSLIAAALPISVAAPRYEDAPIKFFDNAPLASTPAPSAPPTDPESPRPPPVAPVGDHPTAPPTLADRPGTLGITVPPMPTADPSDQTPWWFGSPSGPQPQSINVSSETSIILFVRDSGSNVQVPTDPDIAAGAKKIAFANNSTAPLGFQFAGKLYETVVGNASLNASHDMPVGIPNQTLQLFFDGSPLDIGSAVVTGIANSTIPPPFVFPNGTFQFSITRFPDNGCGPHIFTITFLNTYPGNNYTAYQSSSKDFRIYTSCESTLSISVDTLPFVVVDQTSTFYGTLLGSKVEAVPQRPIQIIMDGKLLGTTGAGTCVDDISVSGTSFSDDFEDLNISHWNQSGTGFGTWKTGSIMSANKHGPELPFIFGTQNIACAGLDADYGKGVDTWLTSPPIDMSAPTDPDPTLSFAYTYQIAYDDVFEVSFSTDGGLTWGGTVVLNASATSGVVTLNPVAGRPTWDLKGIPLNAYIGAPSLLVGFHLGSVDHSAVTSGTGSYTFSFRVPKETAAGAHTIYARFDTGIPLDGSDFITVLQSPRFDNFYEASVSRETIRLEVKRLVHFEFNFTEQEKIGFRGKSLTVGGRLLDNMGEALIPDPLNPLERIDVKIEWDPDAFDPFDTPALLADKQAVDSSGQFSIGYVVAIPQPLGLHNVTFTFPGARYYVNATGLDDYRLMGHTKVIWPAEADRLVYRLKVAVVRGELRIEPSESRFNRQLGDPVDGELVNLIWDLGGEDETNIPPGQVGVQTASNGSFVADNPIEGDTILGKKQVQLTYIGSDIYTPLQASNNWSVVSEVTILFENVSVYKGSYLWMNGSMLDDRGVGVDKQTIQIYLDFEQVAVVSTAPDGTYSVAHAIPTDMTVGNKSVLLRFNGNPIYRPNETISNVSVKAHTQINRIDHTQVVDRGKQLNVSADLYEVYEGGVRGAPVGQEGVAIRISDRQLTRQTTNSEGKVNFRSAVPADLAWGESVLVFEYNGSEFYDAASNETPIVVRGQAQVRFLMELFTLNGAEFNVSNTLVHQQEELAGFAQVTDELNVPLGGGDFRLFYAVQSGAGVLEERRFIAAGPIDELGRFEFNVTWEDFVVGNRSLIGVFNGSFCPTFISTRTLCLKGGEGNVTIQYEYREAAPLPVSNDLLYIAVAAVGTIFAAAFYILWYTAKQRQLQRMQRIIRRAADRLVAGNTYAQAIFEAYRQLARFLQTNGYLRKDSETFREFEVALRQALPIDAKSMDEFLSILEEARYSDHEIGVEQRDRAVATLRAVSASIQQVLLTGSATGGAAQPIQPPSGGAEAPPSAPPMEPGAPPPT